ncbi:MAG: S9 family peptidase, partial [Alloprevotella sp.]|nr:S9 family peptidase [Alloprevotella sp.]
MTNRIPLEDFFRNSPQTAFQLSPDGLHISFLAPYHDRMNIFVHPISDGTPATDTPPTQLTFETGRSIAGHFWADNHRLVFAKDTDGDENYQLYGVNFDGSDMRAYTAFPGVRTSIIDDLEEVEDEILIGMNRRNPEVFDPFRLNLRTGELTQLVENPGNWQGWMTDHEGRLRSVTAIVDGVNTQILYRDSEDEPFRPVLTTNFRESVDFLEFTPDNRLVWAATNLERDKSALVLMNPATCEEIELLYEHPKYDITSISYSRKRKKLLGVFCSGHKETVRHYFDTEEAALRQRLEAHFPGKQFGMADVDKAEENYLYFVGGDRTRGAYYFYNTQEDRPHLVAELAPWLREDDLVPMEPFTYMTRDGLEIE